MKRKKSLSVIIFLLSFLVSGALWSLYGPFETVRKTYICTALSTANHKYLATCLYSDKTIEKYKKKYFNSVPDIPLQNEDSVKIESKKLKIETKDVSVGMSSGKLMIISDPSAVDIAVCRYLESSGLKLSNLVIQENALAGINAGAYVQKGGYAHGSSPGGIIIKDGKVVFFEENGKKEHCLVGFDYKNILKTAYVKNKSEAEKMKLRCGVSFGPPLIVNGKAIEFESGSSLQPRTAIAQRKDGSVLFLVLDGRQAKSPGATLKNVQELLLDLKAVTAVNLDGGSSSSMIYEGKLLNNPSDKGMEQLIPTAFIVRKAIEKQ